MGQPGFQPAGEQVIRRLLFSRVGAVVRRLATSPRRSCRAATRMSHPQGLTGREIGEWYRDRGGRGGGGRGGAHGRPQLSHEEKEALKVQKRMRDEEPQMIRLSEESRNAVSRAMQAAAKHAAPELQETTPTVTGSAGPKYRPPQKRREHPDDGFERMKSSNPMRKTREKLPSWAKREELVKIVRESTAVVVSGETGCGKTTQVPQFLLDDDPTANIVVTQPRRISAVAVAERVAAERGCTVGSEVGYQIRLESKSSEKTRVLFCTTGILLRRLQFDPELSGLTHVIVDEIHERTLDADFLLIILRDLLRAQQVQPPDRPKLKVILMSATLNADLFSEYFGRVPVLHIPGFTFPVTEYFLEDAVELTGYRFDPPRQQPPGRPNYASAEWRAKKKALKDRDPRIIQDTLQTHFEKEGKRFAPATIESVANATDAEKIPLDLIERLCVHIDNEDPQKSAVLIFLPGWDDISKLCDLLGSSSSRFKDRQKYRVLPLHSSLPSSNQSEIFDRPPSGVRKIIVSTNIAETSITIDDVVYVIDSGKFKEKTYDPTTDVSCLLPALISQASARQRRGRAGRVQAGVCYHLFSSVEHENLEEYQLPEMLRTPLESMCLQVKALKHKDAAQFLGKAIQPPDDQAIHNALELLRVIGALQQDEETLTELGQHLTDLPIDPRLGKILIYAVIFRCLDPVLTIAASLGFRNPFVMAMDKKEEADKVKLGFANGLSSDHAAYLFAYIEWRDSGGSRSGGSFARRNFLSHSSMCMIDEMKDQFRRLLMDSGFLSREEARYDTGGALNTNSRCWPMIISVLTAGLYPNVARVDFGRKRVKLTTKNDGRIKLHPGSVNTDTTQYGHHWLTFYERVRSSNLFILDSSPVPPMSLCLFGGQLTGDSARMLVSIAAGDEGIGLDNRLAEASLRSPFVSFNVDSNESTVTVLGLRRLMDDLVRRRVQNPGAGHLPEDAEIIETVRLLVEESIEQLHPGSSRMIGSGRNEGTSTFDGSTDDDDEEGRQFGGNRGRGYSGRGRGRGGGIGRPVGRGTGNSRGRYRGDDRGRYRGGSGGGGFRHQGGSAGGYQASSEVRGSESAGYQGNHESAW